MQLEGVEQQLDRAELRVAGVQLLGCLRSVQLQRLGGALRRWVSASVQFLEERLLLDAALGAPPRPLSLFPQPPPSPLTPTRVARGGGASSCTSPCTACCTSCCTASTVSCCISPRISCV